MDFKMNRSCTIDCVTLFLSISIEKNRCTKQRRVTCTTVAWNGGVPFVYQFVVVVENILRESGAIYPQFFFLLFFNSPYVTFSLQSPGWPGLFTGFCVLSTQINVSDCSYTFACSIFFFSTNVAFETSKFRNYWSAFQELKVTDTQRANVACLIWNLRN